MGRITQRILRKNKAFPLLLVISILVTAVLSCSTLLESPTETSVPNPTKVASDTPSPPPTSTPTITPTETLSPTATPSRSLYSNPSLGLSFMYPSDWTLDDGSDFVAFTRPDGWAQMSVGWYVFEEEQTIEVVADLLVGIRVEDVSEPLVFYFDREEGDPVEVSVQGNDSAGVEWIYHFIVADGGDRALVTETVSTADDWEDLKPIFEEIMLSMERISE
jgi:hypothetical protein